MPTQHEQHIALAKRHIAEGEARIARQTQMIDELARDGHDTTMAMRLLAAFTETLAVMRQHLQQLLDEQK